MAQKVSLLSKLLRKKTPEELVEATTKSSLKKTLGAMDLIILGVGAVVGTGIFTLSGVAIAGRAAAGPSFMISLIIAALACIFAAFCYAEFASIIPVAGSAYTYTFAVFGQLGAWIIGWILMLEYAIGNIAVAIAISSYWFELLKGFEQYLPNWIVNKDLWIYTYTFSNGYHILINIPTIIVIALITGLLYKGVQESTKSTAIMVVVKLSIIAIFIFAGMFYVKPDNWTPFMPGGWNGVFEAAFVIFFAFIGFDAVSTAAEETKNPQRNMPIGIIGTLLICTLIYVTVAAVLTGIMPFEQVVGNKDFIGAPIAYALRAINQNWLSMLISVGAIAGLFSVLLVLQLGTTRILFAMARDKFLPPILSAVHPKFQTPHIITVVTGVFTILGTFFLDLEASADLCNIGTFAAFIVVCIGVMVLRYTQPNLKRGFKLPLMPLIPILGIFTCLFIIYRGIPVQTFKAFILWIAIGVIIYFMYGYKNANLDLTEKKEEQISESNINCEEKVK